MSTTITPTWKTIAAAEPLAAALDALTDHAVRGIPADQTRWCANDFFYAHLKPFIAQLVGWERGIPLDEATPPDLPLQERMLTRDDLSRQHDQDQRLRRPATNPYEELLRTSDAYDVVYGRLLAKLPDCRACDCLS